METFEELERALGDVTFDGDALVTRAVTQGRRLQRRRRVGAAAGVVALGAVTAFAQLPGGGSGARSTGVADDPSITPSPTATPTDTGGLPTPEQTDARLVARLPVPGTLLEAEAPGTDAVAVRRSIDPDGAGQGEVDVFLSSEGPMKPEQVAGADQKCSLLASTPKGDGCQKLPDGWLFVYNADKDPSQGPLRRFMWGATAVFEDGRSVAVRATNYVGQDAADRQVPVLGVDRLEALATDAVWFATVS
jgi:hypothetical protein